jgi:pimeloyl-ACP methyl ester carboxylesterase
MMPTLTAAARSFAAHPLRFHGEGSTQVAYRTIGEGPPLLMIHGFPLHGLTYRKLVEELCGEFTCVVVDLPGAGESVWDRTTDFSFPAHASRLSRLMHDLGHERFAVLGHDTGGSVARHLALGDPRAVRALALINTELPHQRPPWIPFYQTLAAIPGSLAVLRGLLRLRRFRASGAGFGGCFWDERLIEGEFFDLFLAPLIRDRRRMDGYGRYLRGFDWAENDDLAVRHREIGCPVLLLWGRNDPTFPFEHAGTMAGQFPDCVGIEVIENARLLPHEEHFEQVGASLRRFLR